eukprot:10418084-Ditylum_brightwellii.AAC.1
MGKTWQNNPLMRRKLWTNRQRLYAICKLITSIAGATNVFQASGMFCFNEGITSDHRGLFLDFNRFQLLQGDLHVLQQPLAQQ